MPEMTTEKDSFFKELSFNALALAISLLFVVFIAHFSLGYLAEQDRTAGVQDTYRKGLELMLQNVSQVPASTRTTLKEYAHCIYDAGQSRARAIVHNKQFDYVSSAKYAKRTLPADMKTCQEKVIGVVASLAVPEDAKRVIPQMRADIAKADARLYTVKTLQPFLAK